MEYPEIKHLYKYYAYNENSLSVLINKKIWLAKPESFNDPFDCCIEFEDDTDERLLKRILAGIDKGSKQFDKTKQLAIERLNIFKERNFINVGIFSMSEKYNSILMWSHYADQHKGFCIEFVRKPDNPLGNIEMARPIKYSEDYAKIQILDSTGKLDESIFHNYFYTKAIDWKYEEEWRLVYREGGREASIPSSDISSIIFGLEMPQKHRATIKNILSGQDISFKEAIKTDNQFRIDIIDLPE